MVQYKVTSPKCKRCHREPSLMGKEPMYLIPFNYFYFIVCGSCFKKLLNQFGKTTTLDFSNLFTHLEEYHNLVKNFLGVN